MSTLRFYLDEDLPRSLLNALRTRGVDVISTVEAHRRGHADGDQLAFATAQRRVVVTRNVGDFAALHRQVLEGGNSHAGIVALSRQRFMVGESAAAMLHMVRRLSAEEMIDQMLFLNTWRQPA
ncbi:MAG: DUF5615 family PIN-like protein [Dehalococcoidia bacterium]